MSAGKSSEVGLLVGSLSSCSAVGHGVAMSIPTPTDGTGLCLYQHISLVIELIYVHNLATK